MIIEVHADIVMEYRGVYIYTYKNRGVWGHDPPPPSGKFEFLG